MRSLPLAILLSCCLAGPVWAQQKPSSQPTKPSPLPALGHPAGVYGQGVEMQKQVHLADAAKKINQFHGAPIRVEGNLDDVCRKKGCWMVLRDGEATVRVKFKDYGFFVPRDASDRYALVEGVITETEISEELAKHYAEGGGNPEEAKNIKGPQKVLSFTATGVEILGKTDVPPNADASSALVSAALRERLGAAKPVGALGKQVPDMKAALAALRGTKGPRTVEFSLCTELDEWLVFSAAEGAPFTSGFAVKKSGEIVQFGS